MKISLKAKRLAVLWPTLTVAVMMLGASRAEESSILSGATVNFVSGPYAASHVIDGNFKTFVESTFYSPASPGPGSQEVGIHLSSEKKLISAFVVNSVSLPWSKSSMATSAIYAGNDQAHFSAVLTKCSSDIYDTGFLALGQSCIG